MTVARTSDPWTSWAAAKSVCSRERQTEVLWVIRSHGPCTDERLFTELKGQFGKRSESGTRTRRSELVAAGLVRDTGKTAKTSSGRQTIIWEAVRV